MLLVAANEESGLLTIVDHRPQAGGATDPVAPVRAMHQVDEVGTGRGDDTCRHEVMCRRREHELISARAQRDPYERLVSVGTVDVADHARGRRRPAAGADDLVALPDTFDRHVAAGRSNQRARGQALVRVTNDGHVVVTTGEHEDDLVLCLVGVLVLVDEDVLEALPVVLEHVGVVSEQAHGVDEQVVEVHRACLLETCLVLAVDVGLLALEDVRRRARRADRVDQLVLPEADPSVNPARAEPLGVEVQVTDDVAREAHGIGLVVDRELPRVAEPIGVGAQDAHACGVERADPHAADHRANEGAHALAHLVRGLVGERDGEDSGRVHPLVDQVSDAVGQDSGLAGAGARHHEQRPFGVDNGVELVRVQPVGREIGRRRVGEGRVGHLATHPTKGVRGRPGRRAPAHLGAEILNRSSGRGDSRIRERPRPVRGGPERTPPSRGGRRGQM